MQRYTGPKRNAQTYPFPEQRLNLICYPGNNQKTFQNDDHLTDLQKKMFRDDNGELKTYYWIFISLSVVVSSLIMFLQTNFAMLFSMFFHLHLPVKMTEATLYSSITSITATIALFLFVFVALHVNNFYLLYFNISCWFIGCVVIISACRVSQFWLVSGNILIGLGISSAYPMYLAFVENRITVTNRISALQLFCACILSSLTPVLIGQYMEKNPIIFIWVNLGTICILIVVFISMHLMDLWIKAIESKCYD